MKPEQKCPICNSLAIIAPMSSTEKYGIDCTRCGKFILDGQSEYLFNNNLTSVEITTLSSWIWRNQKALLDDKLVDRITKYSNPSIRARANGLLTHISSEYPEIGTKFPHPGQRLLLYLQAINQKDPWRKLGDVSPAKLFKILSLLPRNYSNTAEEIDFLFMDYLVKENEYIKDVEETRHYYISAKGWSFLDMMSRDNKLSDQAFVAMPFANEHKQTFVDGIDPAIRSSGYFPIRMDLLEHNNRIDDEILVQW